MKELDVGRVEAAVWEVLSYGGKVQDPGQDSPERAIFPQGNSPNPES